MESRLSFYCILDSHRTKQKYLHHCTDDVRHKRQRCFDRRNFNRLGLTKGITDTNLDKTSGTVKRLTGRVPPFLFQYFHLEMFVSPPILFKLFHTVQVMFNRHILYRNLNCATNFCRLVAIELISLAALADSSADAVFCCVTESICCKPIVI